MKLFNRVVNIHDVLIINNLHHWCVNHLANQKNNFIFALNKIIQIADIDSGCLGYFTHRGLRITFLHEKLRGFLDDLSLSFLKQIFVFPYFYFSEALTFSPQKIIGGA